jgi:hypothetical protein
MLPAEYERLGDPQTGHGEELEEEGPVLGDRLHQPSKLGPGQCLRPLLLGLPVVLLCGDADALAGVESMALALEDQGDESEGDVTALER